MSDPNVPASFFITGISQLNPPRRFKIKPPPGGFIFNRTQFRLGAPNCVWFKIKPHLEGGFILNHTQFKLETPNCVRFKIKPPFRGGFILKHPLYRCSLRHFLSASRPFRWRHSAHPLHNGATTQILWTTVLTRGKCAIVATFVRPQLS